MRLLRGHRFRLQRFRPHLFHALWLQCRRGSRLHRGGGFFQEFVVEGLQIEQGRPVRPLEHLVKFCAARHRKAVAQQPLVKGLQFPVVQYDICRVDRHTDQIALQAVPHIDLLRVKHALIHREEVFLQMQQRLRQVLQQQQAVLVGQPVLHHILCQPYLAAQAVAQAQAAV